jgi:hypothetical protein
MVVLFTGQEDASRTSSDDELIDANNMDGGDEPC